MTNLFYSLPHPCFELGVRNPFATRAFVDLLADRMGYGSVLLQLFGTLPLFALTETVAGLGGLIGGPKIIDSFRKAVYSI